MKEITRIHLAKTPYSIEVSAKTELEKYLKAIEKRMAGDADVMREIEARLVELLAHRNVEGEGVISSEDVAALREQMGEPKDFSEDIEADATNTEPTHTAEDSPKRLMRDTDNAVVGGVCAGVAAYFNINPLWVRILAIISPFMSFGTSIVVYIVLWLAVPPARTAAEKLQMKGRAVTLDTLREVSEGEQAGVRKEPVLLQFLRIVAGLGFAGIAFAASIGLLVGGIAGVSIVSSLNGLSMQPWAWGFWASMAIGGIAGISLAILIAYSLFSRRLNRGSIVAGIVLIVTIALGLSGAGLFGMQMMDYMKSDQERLTRVVPLELPAGSADAKYVKSEGDVGAIIDSRAESLRAELRYFSPNDSKAPQVKIEKNGDTLEVVSNFDEPSSCSYGFMSGLNHCSIRTAEVKFYGPIGYYHDDSEPTIDDSDPSVDDSDYNVDDKKQHEYYRD